MSFLSGPTRVRIPSWRWTHGQLPNVRVLVVRTDHTACWEHDGPFICTRPEHHRGRHNAATHDGTVVAVWGGAA